MNYVLIKMNYFFNTIVPLLAASLLLTACGGGSDRFTGNNDITDPIINPGNWYRPTTFTTWQWQLQGVVNTSYDVDIYDVDLFDSSAELIQQIQGNGRKVICYFSAGSFEDYRSDATLFDVADIGQTLDGFADERWLDIRSNSVRDIMKARLDVAQQKGCDGVEPDNVDGYVNNSGFNLFYDDQLDYNRFLADEAHARGLAVGLKNDLGQIADLVDYFDFAVNEQCFEFLECGLLTPFAQQNKAILNMEYNLGFIADQTTSDALCLDAQSLGLSTMVLPFALDDSFRFSCL